MILMIPTSRTLKPIQRLLLGAALLGATSTSLAADKQTLRPEVGKPLQAAQAALQAKKYDDASSQIGIAEKVSGLTPYEKYVIIRLKSAVAAGKGDYKGAAADYESLLSSGQLQPAEQLQTLEILVKLDYSAKDFPKTTDAIQRYRTAGGKDPAILSILPQVEYQSGKYADAGKDISAQIAAQEAAGQTPSEATLQLLASCALKQNDMNGYTAALEKLVTYYPKPDYWLDLIARTAGKPGFSDALSLDLDRIRLRTGTLDKAGDYLEATELAVQAGFPGEADTFLKAGYAQKVLGTGSATDIDRQKRLQTLVTNKIASDKASLAQGEAQAAKLPGGDALVNTGLAYVTYGEAEKGLSLMNQGIAKGNLKSADLAKLHLGFAYLLANKKDDALKTFRDVKGNDGSRDLARLYAITARGNAGAKK